MTSIASPCVLSRVIDHLTGRLAQLCLVWAIVTGAGLTALAADQPQSPTGSTPLSLGSALSETYRIQPTDILVIDVINEPKLAGKEFRVSANGELSYPYIGVVKAADRTPAEVQTEIKKLLEEDYLVRAEVLVQVKEFRKRLVSVLGQVIKPGLVEIPAERRLSVNEAITMAGGYTRLARTSDIQLTRVGRSEPIRFTAEELRNPDKAVYVEQGDVIYVPESRI